MHILISICFSSLLFLFFFFATDIYLFQDAYCAQVKVGWCCRASGSYDHTVRLWDIRAPKCVLQLEVRELSLFAWFYLDMHIFHSVCQQFISPWARSLCYRVAASQYYLISILRKHQAMSSCNLFSLFLVMQHEKPLEAVLFFPSGGLLASAGGTEVKVWDIVGGGRQLQTLGNHQKTVTSLAMTAPRESGSALEAPRLLTSSLDGHVRVFDLSNFKVHPFSLSFDYVTICVSYMSSIRITSRFRQHMDDCFS